MASEISLNEPPNVLADAQASVPCAFMSRLFQPTRQQEVESVFRNSHGYELSVYTDNSFDAYAHILEKFRLRNRSLCMAAHPVRRPRRARTSEGHDAKLVGS